VSQIYFMATLAECSAAWEEFWKTRSSESMERLVEIYINLINPYVSSAMQKATPTLGRDEIEAAAILGLYQAIIAFDAGKNIDFEVYGPWRIRGTIADELRTVEPGTLNAENTVLLSTAVAADNHLISDQKVLHVLPSDIAEFLGLFFSGKKQVKDIAKTSGMSETYIQATRNEVLNIVRRTFYDAGGVFNPAVPASNPFAGVINSVRKILGINFCTPIPIDKVGLGTENAKLPAPPAGLPTGPTFGAQDKSFYGSTKPN
jgi:hypothetical protein